MEAYCFTLSFNAIPRTLCCCCCFSRRRWRKQEKGGEWGWGTQEWQALMSEMAETNSNLSMQFYVILNEVLHSCIHPSTKYIMSVHYVPTTVLGAKYNREQNNVIHALCQFVFKIFILFSSSLFFWYGEKCAWEV